MRAGLSHRRKALPSVDTPRQEASKELRCGSGVVRSRSGRRAARPTYDLRRDRGKFRAEQGFHRRPVENYRSSFRVSNRPKRFKSLEAKSTYCRQPEIISRIPRGFNPHYTASSLSLSLASASPHRLAGTVTHVGGGSGRPCRLGARPSGAARAAAVVAAGGSATSASGSSSSSSSSARWQHLQRPEAQEQALLDRAAGRAWLPAAVPLFTSLLLLTARSDQRIG